MRGRLGYPSCGWETCYWIAHGQCIRGKEDTCPEIEWRREHRKGVYSDLAECTGPVQINRQMKRQGQEHE